MIRVGHENHTPPSDVQRRLARVGGLNRFNEPNFRVVWGGQRLDPLGFQRYSYGPNLLERWILEVWRPPEEYGSVASWKKNEASLGPFPNRGDYELFAVVNASGDGFKQITPEIAEYAVEMYRASRKMSDADRRDAHLGASEQREKEWVTFADSVIENSSLPFYGRTAVYQ
jgi:hypothetical protein